MRKKGGTNTVGRVGEPTREGTPPGRKKARTKKQTRRTTTGRRVFRKKQKLVGQGGINFRVGAPGAKKKHEERKNQKKKKKIDQGPSQRIRVDTFSAEVQTV